MTQLAADLIALTGADALAFAQSQFASDVNTLTDGQAQWSCWLNPQGRVIAFFPLFRIGPDRLVLALPFQRGEELVSQLQRFVFRRKCKISLSPDLALNALQPGTLPASSAAPAGTLAQFAPTLPSARRYLLSVADASATINWPGAEDVRDGLPYLSTEVSEQFVAHALGLARLSAISVGKGCYPGQEIVARTHFLGRNKRALCRLQCARQVPAGESLKPVVAEGQAAEVVLSASGEWLAVVHEASVGLEFVTTDGGVVRLIEVFGKI